MWRNDLFPIFFSLACRNRYRKKKQVVISSNLALVLLWKKRSNDRFYADSLKTPAVAVRGPSALVRKAREMLGNRCAFGRWREEWVRFARGSEVRRRVSTGRRRLTRRVEATLVYTNTIDKRRWSRSPRVKRSDTLLSAEMKFIFTVNTWRHTQTGVFSGGFELRTKKEKKWNKGEEEKKNPSRDSKPASFYSSKK